MIISFSQLLLDTEMEDNLLDYHPSSLSPHYTLDCTAAPHRIRVSIDRLHSAMPTEQCRFL